MTGSKLASPPDLYYRKPGATSVWRTLSSLPARLLAKPPTDPRQRAVVAMDRVLLAPPQPEDYRQWADLRRESRAFLEPWEPIWPNDALSRAGFVRRISYQCQEWNADRSYHLMIWRTEDAALLGGIAMTNIRRGVAQAGMVGYWLGQQFTGQGYMAEALAAAIDFGFTDLGLNRIEAATMPHNDASRRLLMRAGFAEEGLASDYLKIAGEWQDHVLYGLPRRRWAPGGNTASIHTGDPDFI